MPFAILAALVRLARVKSGQGMCPASGACQGLPQVATTANKAASITLCRCRGEWGMCVCVGCLCVWIVCVLLPLKITFQFGRQFSRNTLLAASRGRVWGCGGRGCTHACYRQAIWQCAYGQFVQFSALLFNAISQNLVEIRLACRQSRQKWVF